MPAWLAYLGPVLLLIGSNTFMTFAWYWHLKYKSWPLWQVVLISWGLAFLEYWLAVPANRIGSNVYTPAQLKTIQEVITLAVFAGFSAWYLGDGLRWNQVLGFGLLVIAAFLMAWRPD